MTRDEFDWATWYHENCRYCALRMGCELEAKILSGDLGGELRAYDRIIAAASAAVLPPDCSVRQLVAQSGGAT